MICIWQNTYFEFLQKAEQCIYTWQIAYFKHLQNVVHFGIFLILFFQKAAKNHTLFQFSRKIKKSEAPKQTKTSYKSECPICQKKDIHCFKTHIENAHKDIDFRLVEWCRQCHLIIDLKDISKHAEEAHGRKFACLFCTPSFFMDKKGLEQHVSTNHKDQAAPKEPQRRYFFYLSDVQI